MKFRKKPLTIEAFQWNGENTQAILEFCVGACTVGCSYPDKLTLFSTTGLGVLNAEKNDWIMKDRAGIITVMADDIFVKTYEQVE